MDEANEKNAKETEVKKRELERPLTLLHVCWVSKITNGCFLGVIPFLNILDGNNKVK